MKLAGTGLSLAPRALAAALSAGAALAGCAAPEERGSEQAAVTAAASTAQSLSGGPSLYDLADMREARLCRERGARALEKAYRQKEVAMREASFQTAMKEFRWAEDYLHRALIAAPPRYAPVIEREAEDIARFMKQIQKDRGSPKVD